MGVFFAPSPFADIEVQRVCEDAASESEDSHDGLLVRDLANSEVGVDVRSRDVEAETPVGHSTATSTDSLGLSLGFPCSNDVGEADRRAASCSPLCCDV